MIRDIRALLSATAQWLCAAALLVGAATVLPPLFVHGLQIAVGASMERQATMEP